VLADWRARPRTGATRQACDAAQVGFDVPRGYGRTRADAINATRAEGGRADPT